MLVSKIKGFPPFTELNISSFPLLFSLPRPACPACFCAGHPGRSRRPSFSCCCTGASRQRCYLAIFSQVLLLGGVASGPTYHN